MTVERRLDQGERGEETEAGSTRGDDIPSRNPSPRGSQASYRWQVFGLRGQRIATPSRKRSFPVAADGCCAFGVSRSSPVTAAGPFRSCTGFPITCELAEPAHQRQAL